MTITPKTLGPITARALLLTVLGIVAMACTPAETPPPAPSPQPVENDWVLTRRDGTGTAAVYLSKDGLKTILNRELATIYRPADDMVVTANMRSRVYDERPLAEYEKELDRQQARARERIVEAFKASNAIQFSVEPASETATIAGLSARLYKLHFGAEATQYLWLSEDLKLAPKVATFIRRSNAVLSGGVFGEALATLDGYPLRVEIERDGKREVLQEVLTLERKRLAEAEFSPPATYRKATRAEVLKTIVREAPASPAAEPPPVQSFP